MSCGSGTREKLGTYAYTGGSPWGAVLGSDGAIYVTQGGVVPGSGETNCHVRASSG